MWLTVACYNISSISKPKQNIFNIFFSICRYGFLVRSFTRFNQYSHNLLQTIENLTRSLSEYKKMFRFKEETRKSLHIDKGKIIFVL